MPNRPANDGIAPSVLRENVSNPLLTRYLVNKCHAWYNDIGKKDMEARSMTGDMNTHEYEQMLANVDITNDLMFSTRRRARFAE